MATDESKAIRCNSALDRIEKSLYSLEGLPLEEWAELPIKRTDKDHFMLRAIQLETIATWLERVQDKVSVGVVPQKSKK